MVSELDKIRGGFMKRTFRRRFHPKSMHSLNAEPDFAALNVSKSVKVRHCLTVELNSESLVIVSSSKHEKIKRDLEQELSEKSCKIHLPRQQDQQNDCINQVSMRTGGYSSVAKRTLNENNTRREFLCRSLSAELLSKLNEDRKNNNHFTNQIDIKSLSPKHLPKKRNSLTGMKSRFSHDRLKRSQSIDICKQYSLRHLDEQEIKFIKGIIHEKHSSVPELSVCDEKNAKVIITRHQAIMQNIHNRKIKQKIAKRMVEFAALNESRPRSDVGQPLSQSSRGRFYSQQVDSSADLQFSRTHSDPDLYYNSSRKKKSSNELLQEDSESYVPVEETFTPFTAVGSHEDIHKLQNAATQQSVQSILSNFERNSTYDTTNDTIKGSNMLGGKPIPKPRPKCGNSSPIPKPRFRPEVDNNLTMASKPKIKPKPLDIVENGIPGDIKLSPLKSPSKSPLREHNKNVEKKVKTYNSPTTFPAYNIKSPTKQGSTKHGEILPYAIVKLQIDETKETSPMLPPKDISNYSSPKCSPMPSPTTQQQEQYLEPVEIQSPGPVSKSFSKKNADKTKGKRSNYKKSKSLSKSYTEEKINAFSAEVKRRQSLPDYLQDLSAEDEKVYETVSPAMSDEEGWDPDEFDTSSSDEEFTMVETCQAIPKMDHLDGVEKKIYNIVTEILSTERAYVKRLYLLDKVFRERFEQEAKENNVIPEKVVNEIFPNLAPIHKFHSTILLPELEKRIMDWGTVNKIGDIFKTLGHCLLLYTEFVKRFDHATTTLNHWMKKAPKFASIVEELQKRPECEHLSLQHHMLEPVQRVPRYKLLLQDYLKRLPADSPDRVESEASLVIISRAAENANNSMKENEKFKKLLDIEDRIQDGLNGESLVTPSRIFLKEGELIKLAARSGSRMARTALLFNDFLLCCSLTATSKLRVRQIMDLSGLSIDDEDSTLPENSFRVKSRQRVLDLIARNKEDKENWVSAIRAAVFDLHDRRGSAIKKMLEEDSKNENRKSVGESAPLWVKDEDVTMCMLCALKFGLVHRKHHCRGCGRVVCDKCSSHRASLAYSRNEVKRVCFACSQKLGLSPKSVEIQIGVRTRDLSASADMYGEVFWKPPGKGWSKEWLVLTDFVLYIQKKKQDVKAHLTIPVPGYEISLPNSADEIDTSHPHCIKLHKQNKKDLTYYVSSDNKNLITLWEEHLKRAVNVEKFAPSDEGE